MWWPLCSQITTIPRLIYPLHMMYLFVMSLSQIIVFGIITFASDPIYTHYVDAPRIWNISPLVDQQLGGIIMTVGSGFLFLSLLIITFFKWASESNQDEHFGSKNKQKTWWKTRLHFSTPLGRLRGAFGDLLGPRGDLGLGQGRSGEERWSLEPSIFAPWPPHYY